MAEASSVRSRARALAKKRLRDLIADERERAQAHIRFIHRLDPHASRDRLAHTLVSHWTRVAMVEGGLTGALGFLGVPVNLVLFAYCQLAMVVGVSEVYDAKLEGEAGEEAVLGVLGKVHGVEDVIRSSPRILGALAKALALRHGLGTLGRLVPMIAAPISARLNQREMGRTGLEALHRFGNVLLIE